MIVLKAIVVQCSTMVVSSIQTQSYTFFNFPNPVTRNAALNSAEQVISRIRVGIELKRHNYRKKTMCGTVAFQSCNRHEETKSNIN